MNQRMWESVVVGEELPGFLDQVTFTRIVSAPGATLDWYPIHHDPEFAIAKGQPGIVLSTIQIMGLVDRVVTDWAGPHAMLQRIALTLRAPNYPGDHMTLTGSAAGNVVERAGKRCVVDRAHRLLANRVAQQSCRAARWTGVRVAEGAGLENR